MGVIAIRARRRNGAVAALKRAFWAWAVRELEGEVRERAVEAYKVLMGRLIESLSDVPEDALVRLRMNIVDNVPSEIEVEVFTFLKSFTVRV